MRVHPFNPLPFLFGLFRGTVSQAAATLLGVLLSGVLLPACDSTALSLDDPNVINVRFDPEFLQPDSHDALVQVHFLGVKDSWDESSNLRAVGLWDFGEGVFLSTWQFHSDFSLTMGIKRFADAPLGRRVFSFEVLNPHGRFLAQGAFTLL